MIVYLTYRIATGLLKMSIFNDYFDYKVPVILISASMAFAPCRKTGQLNLKRLWGALLACATICGIGDGTPRQKASKTEVTGAKKENINDIERITAVERTKRLETKF